MRDNNQRQRKVSKIQENVLLPVEIVTCEAGLTSTGKYIVKFTFRHLETEEEISISVPDSDQRFSVLEQIIEAVIPASVLNYNLSDLEGTGLMIQIKVKTVSFGTFTNVISATTLVPEYQQLFKTAEIREKRKNEQMKQELEDLGNEMVTSVGENKKYTDVTPLQDDDTGMENDREIDIEMDNLIDEDDTNIEELEELEDLEDLGDLTYEKQLSKKRKPRSFSQTFDESAEGI